MPAYLQCLHRSLPLAAALICSFSLSASAGTATVVSADGESLRFEYANGELLRVNTGDDGYMIIRDNTLYMVSYNNGQPMVINASSMMKGFSGMVQQAAPSAAMAEIVSLKDTGRKETIAGIAGDVYELTVRDDNNEELTDEIVMSKDPRAIEFRDAMFIMARAGQDLIDDDMLEKSMKLQSRLNDLEMGVLRVGSEMQVSEITTDTVAAIRFELPAKPMDMQGLGGLLESIGNSNQQVQ